MLLSLYSSITLTLLGSAREGLSDTSVHLFVQIVNVRPSLVKIETTFEHKNPLGRKKITKRDRPRPMRKEKPESPNKK